jgi:hypothetical protein
MDQIAAVIQVARVADVNPAAGAAPPRDRERDEHRVHEILAEAGPHAALAIVRCEDQQTRQMVAAAAADSARNSWDGSLTEFLAALDPGPAHDWVRAAVGEPSSTKR